jgi:hypothetical protein
MSEASKMNSNSKSFKDKALDLLKTEFPEKTETELQDEADILNEANESIKRLISYGMAPSVAREVITRVLECSAPPNTPEELAELITKVTEEVTNKE